MEEDFFKEEEPQTILTEEKWELIKKEWNSRPKNPPSIQELVKLAFDKEGGGTSVEGRLIKKRLVKEFNLKESKKAEFSLEEEHKKFIDNNYSRMKPLEMARVLFANLSLSPRSKEVMAVVEYAKSLNPNDAFQDLNDVVTEEYAVPKNIAHVLKRVNLYLNERLEEDKLNGKQKKDTASLLRYLSNFRFVKQANSYDKMEDRRLFESTFIRYTYDKFDLAEEEVDQYILLATEVVISADNQNRKASLNRIFNDITEDKDGKISMSLSEAIGKLNDEYNQSIMRQNKLLDSLKVKRSEKEGKDKTGTASIINLVQLMQDEDSRIKMLKFAEKRKEGLKKGVQELMSLEELKAKIIGIDMNDILEG